MTKSKYLYTIDELIDKVRSYNNDENQIELIKKAYLYAKDKHDGQKRKSGEDYVYHPLATAVILTSIYADSSTICAGLLHDVIEDCNTSKKEIENVFGTDIANLVDGVSKISRIRFSTDNDALVEYYKKIIVGMSEDVRVIIVKLADRLHNMRTLSALPLDKQKQKARETLEILTPIAHHLGIHKIKSELEDLSLRYLKPDVFYDIVEKLNNTKLERDQAVFDMITNVSNLLTEHNIKHEIKGRSKSIYSIYKKLEKGRKFSDIYDLLALRILVETEQECYSIIGLIHSKYRPIPNRFKDYIAMPKDNGYQSLHTTVFGDSCNLFEIQIRTYAMNEVAENGVASHWAYKEHRDLTKQTQNITDIKLQFFRDIIELNQEKMSSEDFVNSFKDELLNDNIYVFSPKGDVFEMPVGSTPIDFAYRIHTQVGETMVGAVVNNNIVPLNYELKNNDIIKINTNKASTPSKEWLKIAKNTQTKNKIKSFFSKSDKEVYIERGKDQLEKQLRKRKMDFDFFYDNQDKVFDELKLVDINDLYLNIGNGKYSASHVIDVLNEDDNKSFEVKSKVFVKDSNDILVSGIDNMHVNMASCCLAVPGDEIIGYITKANGISIHRKICPNLDNMDDRMVPVCFNDVTSNKYLTTIIINASYYDNALLDIMQKASSINISIDSLKTINKGDGTVYEVSLWVSNLNQLNEYIALLNSLKFINGVQRYIQ